MHFLKAKAVTLNGQFDSNFIRHLNLSVQVNVYLELFATEGGNRARYNNLSNTCINWRLERRGHGVRAKSVVEYCE